MLITKYARPHPGRARLHWLTNTDTNLYRPWPMIGHEHLTLIKHEKGENTYGVHGTEKNIYKHNILLSEQVVLIHHR